MHPLPERAGKREPYQLGSRVCDERSELQKWLGLWVRRGAKRRVKACYLLCCSSIRSLTRSFRPSLLAPPHLPERERSLHFGPTSLILDVVDDKTVSREDRGTGGKLLACCLGFYQICTITGGGAPKEEGRNWGEGEEKLMRMKGLE